MSESNRLRSSVTNMKAGNNCDNCGDLGLNTGEGFPRLPSAE